MKRKLEISELIFKIVSYVFLTIFAVCCLYPFLYAISASVSGRDAVEYGQIVLLPKDIQFDAFAEMFNNIGNKVSSKVYYAKSDITRRFVLKDVLRHWKLLIKSSAIGTFVGILPGIGASMAIFLAYGEAKRCSKTANEIPFGEGNKEGIIAAESANNALVGGTMVPMLALGIPGSPTAAMIGSALTIHGLMCGPELFSKSPDIAYTFMYGMLIAYVACVKSVDVNTSFTIY